MARTRSKPAAKDKTEATPESSTSSAQPLPPSTANPPKLFVLPKNTSKDARIVTLDNPTNSAPSRYFFCPEKGFHEFTKIAAPKKDCKSWLISGEKSMETDREEKSAVGQESINIGSGYVAKSADLFIATPIDLLFLILPALAPKTAKEREQHFLALDDHLDTLSSISRQWKVLLAQYPSLSAMIRRRIGAVCDTVEAGNETMYRISHQKLLSALLKKAERMCKNGLPSSLEEKFVKTALEVPVMTLKREESSLSAVAEPPPATEASQTSTSTPSTIADSQLSFTTSSDSQTSTSSASTAATSVAADGDPPSSSLETPSEVPQLLRLRIALTFLTASYLAPAFRQPIQSLLATCSTLDFAPLDAHLSRLAKIRAEAAALRSISDNISRKRGFEEDDERMAEREEKKRKKEEEEKKKKNESRSIKQLKKVDTTGMKKLSAFFTKAPKKA